MVTTDNRDIYDWIDAQYDFIISEYESTGHIPYFDFGGGSRQNVADGRVEDIIANYMEKQEEQYDYYQLFEQEGW